MTEGAQMDYQRAVAEGAAALSAGEQANWKLARLTSEVAETVSITKWANDVRDSSGRKFSHQTASLYARIWERHGIRWMKGEVSWADAYDETRGKTPDERMGDYNLERGILHATPEAKRKALIELAGDTEAIDDETATVLITTSVKIASPKAVAKVWDDDKARLSLSKGAVIHEQEQDARREHLDEQTPAVKRINQMRAALDLEQWVIHVGGDIERLERDILPRLGNLPESREDPLQFRRFLQQALDGLDPKLERIRSYVREGRNDIDVFLQSVLGGSR
jgi:hypothetical protein